MGLEPLVISNAVYLHLEYAFRTFAIYTPPGADSMSVPLVYIDWEWGATANYLNDHWTLQDGFPTPSAPDPVYQWTSDEPEWSEVLVNGTSYWIPDL